MAGLLFLMILLNYLDRVILSLVSPLMRKELGLTPLEYAYAVDAFLVAYGVMYLGSGVVLDRVGSRLGLAVFVGFWSLACSLHAATAGLSSLVVFRFLLGVTEPGGWTGAVKTVSERFTAAQRGLASGIFAAGAGVGSLIAPPLVVFISLHYGWRSAFLIAGVAGLLWVPAWLQAVRCAPGIGPAEERVISLRQDVPRLLRDRRAQAFMATRFFGDTTGYFFLFWLPEYLISSKSFSFAAVGALAWIPFCWQDIGSLAGGYASSRMVRAGRAPLWSRKIMMSLAAVFVVLGTLFQTASGAWWVILSVSLCTFGVGVWAGNLHAVAMDAFPHREVASVHGLAGSAGAVGGVLFNTLVGHLSARGNYCLIFAVLALLQPLGVAALWMRVHDSELHDSNKLG